MLAKLDQLLKLGENEQVLALLAQKDSLSLEERIYQARALEMRFDESIFEAEAIISEVLHQLESLNDPILEFQARSVKLHILYKFQNFIPVQREIDAWEQRWAHCTPQVQEALQQNYLTYLLIKTVIEPRASTDIETWKATGQKVDSVIEKFEQIGDYYNAAWAIHIQSGVLLTYDDLDAYRTLPSRLAKTGQYTKHLLTSPDIIKLFNAYILFYEGKRDQGLKNYEETFTQFQKSSPPWLHTWLGSLGLGLSYLISGQYAKVIGSVPKFMAINKRLKNAHLLSWDKRILGEAYYQTGDIITGKRLIEEAVEIVREIDDTRCLVNCLVKSAKLNYFLGETEKALEHLREAQGLLSTDHPLSELDIQWFLEGYYFIMVLFLEQGRRTEAEHFFKMLTQRYRPHSSKIMDFYISLGEILLLKYEKRATKKALAQAKLEELLQTTPEGWLSQEIYFYAVTHYLDLLLQEFSTYQEPEVLDEILRLLNKNKQAAQQYHQPNFLVQLSGIEAKLLVIKGDLQKAHDLLENLAQDDTVIKTPHLKKQVENELSTLTAQFNTMKRLITANASLGEKIRETDLVNYIEEAKKKFRL
ncbi:MAG: tetratricopeptide repeat protein [Candidatus Hermodarchaeota archaeon]